MNIIFLDIDGVLNTERFQKIQIKNGESSIYDAQFFFDPIAMNNLRDLINQTNSHVVISSSWRTSEKYYQELLYNFKQYKLLDRIIGKTPILFKEDGFTQKERGLEIQSYLDNNKNIDNFVIIDDEDDLLHLENKLAKCNEYYGFTKEVKEKALKILQKR